MKKKEYLELKVKGFKQRLVVIKSILFTGRIYLEADNDKIKIVKEFYC